MKNKTIQGSAIALASMALCLSGGSAGELEISDPVIDTGGPSFELIPYFWIANIEGTTGVAGQTADLDLGFGDIAQELDFGASAAFGIQTGKKLGFLADIMYLNISPGAETQGPLFDSVRLGYKDWMVDLKATYRIHEGANGFIDLLGGARYKYIDMNIVAQPGLLPGFDVSGSEGWWDAVGGVRTKNYLSDRVFLSFLGDVGAGASNLTWQAFGGIGYEFTELFDLVVGYRYMVNDYADNGVTYDLTTQGIGIGAGFRW